MRPKETPVPESPSTAPVNPQAAPESITMMESYGRRKTIEQLGGVSLSPKREEPRIVCSIAGHEKSGKSHFSMTAPGPIAVIASDTGTGMIAQKFANMGKSVTLFQVRSAKDLQDGGSRSDYTKEWVRVKSIVDMVVDNKRFRTMIWDTACGLWELCRLSAFGKLTQVMPHHYVIVNTEYSRLVKMAYQRGGLNAIYLHKVKREYKKEQWTGKYERAGMNDMPYLVDINLENSWRKETVTYDDGTAGVVPVYCCECIDSRVNPENAVGLKLETFADLPEEGNCDIPHLGASIWPDTGIDYWMS